MKREPERALALPFSGELEGKGARAVALLIENSGADDPKRIIEFSTARIRNPHTRRAYVRAVGEFLAFCAERGKLSLAYSGEAGQAIRRKLDSDSEGRWTLIPKEAGQRFRRKVDTRFDGI